MNAVVRADRASSELNHEHDYSFCFLDGSMSCFDLDGKLKKDRRFLLSHRRARDNLKF